MLEDEGWIRIPEVYFFKHRLCFWGLWLGCALSCEGLDRRSQLALVNFLPTSPNLSLLLPKAVGDVFAFAIYVIAIQSLIGGRAAQWS